MLVSVLSASIRKYRDPSGIRREFVDLENREKKFGNLALIFVELKILDKIYEKVHEICYNLEFYDELKEQTSKFLFG